MLFHKHVLWNLVVSEVPPLFLYLIFITSFDINNFVGTSTNYFVPMTKAEQYMAESFKRLDKQREITSSIHCEATAVYEEGFPTMSNISEAPFIPSHPWYRIQEFSIHLEQKHVTLL